MLAHFLLENVETSKPSSPALLPQVGEGRCIDLCNNAGQAAGRRQLAIKITYDLIYARFLAAPAQPPPLADFDYSSS